MRTRWAAPIAHFTVRLWCPDFAKRMECVQLAGAFDRGQAFESGSKPRSKRWRALRAAHARLTSPQFPFFNRKYCWGALTGAIAWLPQALDTGTQACAERFVVDCSVQSGKPAGHVMATPPSVGLMNT